MEDRITGVMVYYYFVCKRKLWYFCHEISMEDENESVMLGKLLDENSYKRNDKHINIDNVINIDFIKERKELHEVKKSKAIEEASIWQVKYYLYYLKQRGVDGLKAKIDYPLLKKNVVVELAEEDITRFKEILGEIQEIKKSDIPLTVEKNKICKKCAYYDLCFI
jgi:CRISPR-associated exonuclease Cas4